MASEIVQQPGASDDPLDKALAELSRPAAFSKLYDPSMQRHDETLGPIVSALRQVIGEVQSLRDELEELRNER